MKEEALWLLRTNSPRGTFEEDIKNFGTRLNARGNPDGLVGKILSEVHFADTKAALTQKENAHKKILPNCITISIIAAMFEKHSNGQMAFDTKPATSQRD